MRKCGRGLVATCMEGAVAARASARSGSGALSVRGPSGPLGAKPPGTRRRPKDGDLSGERRASSKGAGLAAGACSWPAAPAAGQKARAPTGPLRARKRSLRPAVAACIVLLVAGTAPANAWNDFAHEVVARIAWEELEPDVRERVLALFRQAPGDSLMHCLDLNQDRRRGCGRFAYRLGDAESAEDGDRILFERAAYWPDLARQLEEYNRPTWHYIGWTWRQGADGSAHETDLPVAEPNAVSQLVELARSVGDTSGRPDKRAIHLAWIFHLVGDIHQPLHAASRVTARRDEREGDRGGNGFGLDDWNRNLHAFWDGVLDGRFRAEYRQRGARATQPRFQSTVESRAVLGCLRGQSRP